MHLSKLNLHVRSVLFSRADMFYLNPCDPARLALPASTIRNIFPWLVGWLRKFV